MFCLASQEIIERFTEFACVLLGRESEFFLLTPSRYGGIIAVFQSKHFTTWILQFYFSFKK